MENPLTARLSTVAVRDPEATELARALDIQSTPFAVEVERGAVTRKAYLHGASDLIEFVGPEIPSPAKGNSLVEVTKKEASEGSN